MNGSLYPPSPPLLTAQRVRCALASCGSRRSHSPACAARARSLATAARPTPRRDLQSSALVATSAPASSSSALAAPSAGPLAASSLADSSVKLEVGIEDCLHIEFEYDATRLALDDDVTGRVHFLLVRIRIRTMELALVRRETVGAAGGGGAGSGSAGLPESETLTRFELMDGCPVRGEVIPIRMPLAGLDLTPTFSVDVAGGGGAAGGASTFFSVRYFLNLVLLDDEDRRYFKSQELWLHRRQLDAGTAPAGSAPGTGGV